MVSEYKRPQSDNWPHYCIEKTIPEKRSPPQGAQTGWLDVLQLHFDYFIDDFLLRIRYSPFHDSNPKG